MKYDAFRCLFNKYMCYKALQLNGNLFVFVLDQMVVYASVIIKSMLCVHCRDYIQCDLQRETKGQAYISNKQTHVLCLSLEDQSYNFTFISISHRFTAQS